MAWGELDPTEPPKYNPADEVDGREHVERVLAGVESEAHIGGLTVVSGKLTEACRGRDIDSEDDDECFLVISLSSDEFKAAIGCLGSKVMLIGEPWGGDE